ncbi:MAG TPA: hypothetical protein VGD33_02455 [Chitinophagaceae bacterium]
MRLILIAMIFPLFSMSQTVHIDDDKIKYSGSFKTSEGKEYTEADVSGALTRAIHHMNKSEAEATGLKRDVEITLNTPYQLIRKVKFDIELSIKGKEINYEFDKFSLEEKQRGGKTETTSGKDLVSNMGESGKLAIETESILNEIDMRVQQLLTLISKELN